MLLVEAIRRRQLFSSTEAANPRRVGCNCGEVLMDRGIVADEGAHIVIRLLGLFHQPVDRFQSVGNEVS
jgi:hypothetical protein